MASPTNKDRLKNSSDEELLSLIKGMRLDHLKDNEILKVFKSSDTRSAFRKYMFGGDSKLEKAQEAVSEMDSTFEEIQGTKKRRYGLLSDVKRKSLERKQRKNNKTIVSAMESSVKKTHKKEALSRTFTMSKGKKILSLRTEKQTLKASMDYADDLIKHYIKQGDSQDSKNIVELKRFIEESEGTLASVNNELYKVKGGAKFAEKRIQSLSASFAVVGEELSAKQEEFNAKILEKQEQMTELLGEGFDEQSEVIKQLQKDLLEAEKDKEEALKEITDRQEEINKEIGYLRARGDEKGGGFGFDIGKKLSKAKGAVGGLAGSMLGKVSMLTAFGMSGDGGGSELKFKKSPSISTAPIPQSEVGSRFWNQSGATPSAVPYSESNGASPYKQTREGMIATQAILEASRVTGVPSEVLFTLGAFENSSGVANAKNSESSASGLFQITNDTWRGLVERHGKKHNISIDDKNNPRANAIMGAYYIKENYATNAKKGRRLNTVEIYLNHLLGAGNYDVFYAGYSNPKTLDTRLSPSFVKSVLGKKGGNKRLLYSDYPRNTRVKTYREFYNDISNELNTKSKTKNARKYYDFGYGSKQMSALETTLSIANTTASAVEGAYAVGKAGIATDGLKPQSQDTLGPTLTERRLQAHAIDRPQNLDEYNKAYGIKSNASAVKQTNTTTKEKADVSGKENSNVAPKKDATSSGALTEGKTMNTASTSIAEGAK